MEIISFFHSLSSISVHTASKEGLSIFLRMQFIRQQRVNGGEIGDRSDGIVGNLGGGVEKRKGC